MFKTRTRWPCLLKNGRIFAGLLAPTFNAIKVKSSFLKCVFNTGCIFFTGIEVQDSQESLLLSLSKMVLALTEIARIDKIIKTALIDFLIASPPRSLLNLRSHKETISQMSLG